MKAEEKSYDRANRQRLKERVLTEESGKYSCISELFCREMDPEKFTNRVKRYMEWLDEHVNVSETGHEEIDERVLKNYAQAMAGFRDILNMLPISDEENGRLMQLTFDAVALKQMTHLLKNIESHEATGMTEDLEENKSRLESFLAQCSEHEVWENFTVKSNRRKENFVCFNMKLKGKPYYINLESLFPNGKKERNVSLLAEKSNTNFFQWKDPKKLAYGRKVRPFVWSIQEGQIDATIVDMIIKRVKEIGIDANDIGTLMKKVRDFYGNESQSKEQQNVQIVHNLHENIHQKDIVSLVTRFLIMKSHCQQKFMTYVNEKCAAQLELLDLDRFELQIENNTQLIAELFPMVSESRRKKLFKYVRKCMQDKCQCRSDEAMEIGDETVDNTPEDDQTTLNIESVSTEEHENSVCNPDEIDNAEEDNPAADIQETVSENATKTVNESKPEEKKTSKAVKKKRSECSSPAVIRTSKRNKKTPSILKSGEYML